MIQFEIDISKQTTFPHYWEKCVGSSHAYTALREDYRSQLKKAHEELGFQYVRFHGLLDDKMSVLIRKRDHFGNDHGLVYNFVNIDNIFDWLLENGMKPFVELGFMPSAIARGDKTIFHYKANISPPGDYRQWETLIDLLVRHLLERYGVEEVRTWFFEVWNEPNLFFFFDGDREEYFKLYEATARTIKGIDECLQVGGPATSCNSWVKDTVKFCRENNVPLDFISTHHYPTDDPLWQSGMDIGEFYRSEESKNKKYHRGVLKKMTQRVREEAGELPVYFTEWNTSDMTNDNKHDEPYAAAMAAKTLADNDGLVQGYAFWTFSDIFEESGQLAGAYHGGFGLQTYVGVAKPIYRLFQMYHHLGDVRLHVACDTKESTVEMIATKTRNGYGLILYNHNVEGEAIQPEEVSINLDSLGPIKEIKLYRIDDAHANAKAVWNAMGRPEYPSRKQIEMLHEASVLKAEPMAPAERISFIIPSYGVVAVEVVV